jgi:hypothetical protein
MSDENNTTVIDKILQDFPEWEFTQMDGYDNCLVGVVEQFGRPPILCYDRSKVIAKLCEEGMELEEALDFFYFNQIGSWVGETTPCFITLTSEEENSIEESKLKEEAGQEDE